MTDYQAPVAEQRFVLDALVGLAELAKLPGYEHADVEMVGELLSESGRLASEVVAPLNVIGDTEGCKLVDSQVVTPPGFKQAYEQFVEAGWPAVSFPEAYDGGGFPSVVGLAILEQFSAASMAFSLCPMLTFSGVEMLLASGSEEQREKYLRKLVSGEWTGTMNLTEPEAGSDVGALRMRAEPQSDGTYKLFGQKIFITHGNHDFTENIIHIVIARTPGSPAGTKGISCFIVPDYLVANDGSLGERNDVRPVSLEHKMGIHASPTCVMSFGDEAGAVGYLVGEEGRGMNYMFTMMNHARLAIALQGLAITERAYQAAVDFARTREQGRVVGRDGASPIVGHPDVRRMLMTMRCQIDAMRGVMYRNAAANDVAAKHPDERVREMAAGEAALLTPISKGWGTDLGVELTSLAIQIFGGAGFVEETGVAQHYRDARIAPIYEGTNGIQAIDLAGRKLGLEDGKVMDRYLAEISETIAALPDEFEDLRLEFEPALGVVVDTTTELRLLDVRARLSGATPYMQMMGVIAGGHELLRAAIAAKQLHEDGSTDHSEDLLAAKPVLARFYAEQILPKVYALQSAVLAGDEQMFALADENL